MAAKLGAHEVILGIIEKALENHESTDCPVSICHISSVCD